MSFAPKPSAKPPAGLASGQSGGRYRLWIVEGEAVALEGRDNGVAHEALGLLSRDHATQHHEAVAAAAEEGGA